jgi:diguanylate cyclase (GGDEF)-like protein
MNERFGFLAIDVLIAGLGLVLGVGLFIVGRLMGDQDEGRTSVGWAEGGGRITQAVGATVPILLAVGMAAWLFVDARPEPLTVSVLAAMVVAGAFLAPLVFLGPTESADPISIIAFSIDIAVLGIVAWSTPSPIVVTALLPVAYVSIVFALGWRVGVPLGALALAACVAGLLAGPSGTSRDVILDVASTSVISAALALAIVASVELGRRRQRQLINRLTSDPVTALHTRAQLDLVLEQELSRSKRFGRPLSILMIDLDRMKGINDSLGHQAGDRYLRSVGRAIGASSRRSDFAARFGGDEFVVVLPETPRAGAATIAGILERRVSSIQIAVGSHVLSASASIGIATYPDDGTTQAQLLAHADLQMYAEKLGHRSAVTVAADAGG